MKNARIPLLGAALAASVAVTAQAADQTSKPQASQAVTLSQQNLPRPDFVVVIAGDGSMILDNIGNADFTGKVELDVTCKVLTGGAIKPVVIGQSAPSPAMRTCGSAFTDGKHHKEFASFPKGHGVKVSAPIEPPAGTSLYQDGRIVIHLLMPKGTYEMTATADPGNKITEKNETNNTASRNPVTVQ